MATGATGEGRGLQTKLFSHFVLMASYLRALSGTLLPAGPLASPSIPLAHWSFLAPGSVEGQAYGFLWEGEAEVEAEVEQWGVLGSGVQVRCAPAAAHPEGRRDPMDRPASAAALRSFVPPQRWGLPRVPFPARDGIDSQSQRG